MMFIKYMTIILLILSGAILYCGHALSLPSEDATKFSIDFKRAYYKFKAENYLIENRIFLGSLNRPKVSTKKVYQIKTYINRHGYRCFKDSHMLFHRWMMEKHLNRKLYAKEVVHHIDGNKLNNKISNLKLFPNQKEHDRHHRDHFRNYGTWYEEVPEYAVYNPHPQYSRQY